MEILCIRIDERLIHAQVTLNWINELKPDRIVIVDDNILADDFQRTALKLSCPKGIKLTMLESQNLVSRLSENFFQGEKIFLLCKGIKAIKRMVKYGYIPDEVIIGNLHYLEDDKIKINDHISISPEQKQNLLELHDKGIKFYYQLLSQDEKEDIIKLIN